MALQIDYRSTKLPGNRWPSFSKNLEDKIGLDEFLADDFYLKFIFNAGVTYGMVCQEE
jgi:hypothetical protein